MISELELLTLDEGYRKYIYLDTKGYKTIGIGRCLDKNPITLEERQHILEMRKDTSGILHIEDGISLSEATYLLSNAVAKIRHDLDLKIPWWKSLSVNRQAVLVSMAFNLGVIGLVGSKTVRGFTKTLKYMENGQFDEASEEMKDFQDYQMLKNRYDRLSQIMKDG